MNEKIYTRKATAKDLNILLKMGYELFLVEKEFESLMTFSKEEARSRYYHQLQNPNALFLLLYVDEVIAGYAYTHLDNVKNINTSQSECELEVIYLYPQFRGRRFSSFLISEVIEWAKEKSAFRIKTDIFVKNKASIKAFENQGFQTHNTSFILDIDKE
jgi:RimJ/RimL family protein N-acetyltransferase